MILRVVYLKNSTFPSLKITGDTLIDVKNKTSKHHHHHPFEQPAYTSFLTVIEKKLKGLNALFN